MAELDDGELLWLLDGDANFRQAVVRDVGKRIRNDHTPGTAGRIDRLGIPGFRFTDGPRGARLGRSTSFPVAIARAASWDPELERAVGEVIGAEARAFGANMVGAPCINLAPFPGWGRSQESYGEDPVLLGAMGAALSAGLRPWVLSTVKHYACNSMDEARFVVDVRVAEDVLREVYLPHFLTVVEAGVDAVMSAYNSLNGEWAGENRHLLTEILRDEWGFAGFVVTDWFWGLRHPVESVGAGQDLEMPLRQQRARTLRQALADGRLDRADVTRAATRLLRAQVELALRARPTPPTDVVACPRHRQLAREVATRGAVLLRNEPVSGRPALPLSPSSLRRLAVVGRLADKANLGDIMSSGVRPPSTVSVLQGLREQLGDRVVTSDHAADPAAAADLARTADAVVVVVGLGPGDEGEALVALDPESFEVFGGILRRRAVATALSRLLNFSNRWKKLGGDRRDLRLRPADVDLVRAVAAANPHTVVVVIGGGTVVLDPWDAEVPAVVMAWYPGMEGGRALADVLLGEAEPAGRLPLAIPRRQSDLPGVDWLARTVTYDRWWGQRKLDRDGVQAAYPLGFGLGYTTFALGDLTVEAAGDERFSATVTVTNTGTRPGRHVVQVYAHLPGQQRPVRALVGFRSVAVDAGASTPVTVDCTTRPLRRWTADGFVLDVDQVTVEAASWSGDPDALGATVTGLGGRRRQPTGSTGTD